MHQFPNPFDRAAAARMSADAAETELLQQMEARISSLAARVSALERERDQEPDPFQLEERIRRIEREGGR